MEPMPANGHYPIRTVASITGVNPVTLRAWERRYGLIRPQRSETGHRLYTRRDIERIQRILELLEAGVAIGRMKEVLEAEVRETPGEDLWSPYRRRMLAAIARFDEAALDDAYNDALAAHGLPRVTAGLLVPLLREIGHRWERGEGLVAEEHFFHVYLRHKLGALFHHRRRLADGPVLVAACLPGELHEIGLLLFAQAASERHYRPVILGANTPLEDLPQVVRRAGAGAVVLSGSMTRAEPGLEEGMRRLVAAVEVPVLVGGVASVQLRDLFVRAGAVPLGEDLEHGLRQLDSRLSGAR